MRCVQQHARQGIIRRPVHRRGFFITTSNPSQVEEQGRQQRETCAGSSGGAIFQMRIGGIIRDRTIY